MRMPYKRAYALSSYALTCVLQMTNSVNINVNSNHNKHNSSHD